MNRDEPILTQDDHDVYRMLTMVARARASMAIYRFKVDLSRHHIKVMLKDAPDAVISWSAGKDSTAMAHLCASCGVREAISVKDDLDFPGEEEYIIRYAKEWGISLEILRPPFSLQEWLSKCGAEAGDDLHSRATAFSQEGFYRLLAADKLRRGYPGVYLGLRAAESKGRKMNYSVRGALYDAIRDGTKEPTCTPIVHWEDLDVWAYLISNGIDPLPVYRCLALHHRASPGRLRKSWWVPGSASQDGQVIWLRHYWPSLYRRLLTIMPEASQFA